MAAVSDSINVSLVLELMPHGNFHQLIDRFGPFNQLDACFYYCNIACAIEFIHNHGLVSRDIKPENFLVGHDGYLVMTDLGVAEEVDGDGSWHGIGTTQYKAPELFQQGSDYEFGKAVDWWASGVILYETLTQKLVCFTNQITIYPPPLLLYLKELSNAIIYDAWFLVFSHSREPKMGYYPTTS